MRKEIIRYARELNRQHRQLFMADPRLKNRAARLLRSLLPPKPRRRGRPGPPDVTQAIRLRREFRQQFPDEPWPKLRERIYPQAIPNYATMCEWGQANARQELRERVRWRQRAKKRRR